MPELPKVLRDGLSARERSVLVLGKDGPQAVKDGLKDCRSIDHAESLLNTVRMKAGRLIAVAKIAEERQQRAPVNGGPSERDCLCGERFFARDGERRCPACRELGAEIVGPRDSLLEAAGVPAEEAVTVPEDDEEDEGAGEERILRKEPPTLPPAPESDPDPLQEETSTPALASPARPCGRGGRRQRVLDALKRERRIRQADLREMMGIDPGYMSELVRWLRQQPGVEVGPMERRSLVLIWRGEDLPTGPLISADVPADEPALKPSQPLVMEEPEPEPETQDLVPGPEPETQDLVLAGGEPEPGVQDLVRQREASPDASLHDRYLEALLIRIEGGDTSPELLDRFERLTGLHTG